VSVELLRALVKPLVILSGRRTARFANVRLPAFAAIATRKSERVTFVGIDSLEPASAGAAFVEQYQVTTSSYPTQRLVSTWDTDSTGCPITLFISASGTAGLSERIWCFLCGVARPLPRQVVRPGCSSGTVRQLVARLVAPAEPCSLGRTSLAAPSVADLSEEATLRKPYNGPRICPR